MSLGKSIILALSMTLNVFGQSAFEHLEALQKISDENNNNRSAGTSGHSFTAHYIAVKLLNSGYKVDLIPFTFDKFTKLSDAKMTVTIDNFNTDLIEDTDHQVMSFSSSGDVNAPIASVDLDLGPGNNSTSGCEEEDFSNFPLGSIALIQRGSCSFLQKAVNAEKAGALGVLIFNQGNEETRKEIFGGTLSADSKVKIPVFSLSYDIGVKLSEKESSTRISVETKTENFITYNVIAETPGGNPDSVIMLGSHLDSVPEGPGMNDNGSGSAALLQIAQELIHEIKDQTHNKLRFAWWSAEEVGLIGSSRYVESLTADSKSQIAAYLNFDMIASVNYMLGVFDGDGSKYGQVGPSGSDAIEKKFHDFFTSVGQQSIEVELSGRSDYAPFAEVGIPVGGLFTGAEGTKSEAEAAIYGGKAGEAYDPCYHKECDNIDNIDTFALDLNAQAMRGLALEMSLTKFDKPEGLFSSFSSRQSSKVLKDNSVRFEKTANVHCSDDHFLE